MTVTLLSYYIFMLRETVEIKLLKDERNLQLHFQRIYTVINIKTFLFSSLI